MKEYLIPSRNYEYILTDAREALEPHAKDWIEIPEWANYAYKNDAGICFLKGELGFNHPLLTWVRPTQPKALPFIDDNPQSLNDQYAEIEQVRQAFKVKSGSDSDHALDAMSFGLMGAGVVQENSGAKMRENNHYFIDVSDVDEVDFYEIAKRYNVTDPAVQHILKKCLAIGNRGHKDLETDLKDILKTAKRALQINGFGE